MATVTQHTIDCEGLREWQNEAKLLYASSNKEYKQIYATLIGNYEVWHKEKRVLETMSIISAVEAYNSIK